MYPPAPVLQPPGALSGYAPPAWQKILANGFHGFAAEIFDLQPLLLLFVLLLNPPALMIERGKVLNRIRLLIQQVRHQNFGLRA